MQSLILDEMLPIYLVSYTGSDVLICGCEMGCVNVLIHRVYLESDLVTGPVKFTFMHLADAFIQRTYSTVRLYFVSFIIFFIIFFLSMCVPWELTPQHLRC